MVMKSRSAYDNVTAALVILLVCAGFLGCAPTQTTMRDTRVIVEESPVMPDPGAVEFVWEAPIVDVVDVPPGLDPEGHYYRPAHQSIMEIRQGRWNYYRHPEDE